MKAAAGDRVIVTSCCGGGYGDPLLRPAEQVAADVVDGHISAEAARCDYGVVLTDTLTLDAAATARERAAPRQVGTVRPVGALLASWDTGAANLIDSAIPRPARLCSSST